MLDASFIIRATFVLEQFAKLETADDQARCVVEAKKRTFPKSVLTQPCLSSGL